ncbi:hypothetical protein HanIR_Chr01g0031611 [Helianthus annuus]|nr:hypothetical protein HanIR_Chr01g0031611 [Helianthus annuus]
MLLRPVGGSSFFSPYSTDHLMTTSLLSLSTVDHLMKVRRLGLLIRPDSLVNHENVKKRVF